MTLFDAGARTMTRAVARAGARSGGIAGSCSVTATPTTAAPPRRSARPSVPPRRGDRRRGQRRLPLLARGAEGDPDAAPPGAALMHRYAWDGGPVQISGTLSEGDEVAGFSVVELPGHAPGQIGAVARVRPARARQRLLLHARHLGPRLRPHVPFPVTTTTPSRRARAMRKLAEMEPAAAWPGHAEAAHGRRARRAAARRRRPGVAWESARAAAGGEAAAREQPRRAGRPSTRARTDALLRLRGSLTPGSRGDYAAGARQAASIARGRRAARVRAAVRAPRGELDRGRRPDLEASASCSGGCGWPHRRERQWVRETLREHCAEWFPDVEVP